MKSLHRIPNEKMKGYSLSVIGCISWAFSGICGEVLMNAGIPPRLIVSVRLLLSGVVLLFISSFQSNDAVNLLKNKKDLLRVLAFGLGGVFTSQFGYIHAIYYTNAPTATILQFLSSAMLVAVVCLLEKRLPKFIEVSAVILAIFGITVLTTHLNLHTLIIDPSGLFWGFFSAFGVVGYVMLPSQLFLSYNKLSVIGLAMLLAGLLSLPILRPWKLSFTTTPSLLPAWIGIVLIGTIVAYTFFIIGAAILGPTTSGLISGLEAVASVLFSVLLLGASFHPLDLAGMGLVLVSILLLSLRDRPPYRFKRPRRYKSS
ncbi:DMT family transporter [Peptoniphilus equinus]|uniref:DMT family transporter n=1 Tax=Peptoniphilus equinus TaxID=3016343 RepID=A0ABY7QTH1_9FIRM|nr:DMT family transporter [Peptoniphilus equinus]WBW50088.1 DMT family transporter [Peptoniphilus equinus]